MSCAGPVKVEVGYIHPVQFRPGCVGEEGGRVHPVQGNRDRVHPV